MKNGELLRVEVDDLRGVLNVDEDAALAVGDGEFWLAAESECDGDGAVSGADGGGVLAASVQGEDALGNRVVDDGVGIGAGGDGAEGLERLEVENGDVVGAAVADVAAAEIGNDSDAVDALGVRNIALDRVGICIHDDDMRGVRDVDAACISVNRDVIPALVAGNRKSLYEVIAGGTGGQNTGVRVGDGKKRHKECRRRYERPKRNCFSHE